MEGDRGERDEQREEPGHRRAVPDQGAAGSSAAYDAQGVSAASHVVGPTNR
jgi:hypothetical protein